MRAFESASSFPGELQDRYLLHISSEGRSLHTSKDLDLVGLGGVIFVGLKAIDGWVDRLYFE